MLDGDPARSPRKGASARTFWSWPNASPISATAELLLFLAALVQQYGISLAYRIGLMSSRHNERYTMTDTQSCWRLTDINSDWQRANVSGSKKSY